MEIMIGVVQMLIALGILNVWLVRATKDTSWRGGAARTLAQEFEVYGLPAWFMRLVGALKVTTALLLILGLWIPAVTRPAAMALAVMMLGAVVMHFRVNDPLKKSQLCQCWPCAHCS